MIAWASMGSTDPRASHYLAYSVRPDLWVPGSIVEGADVVPADWSSAPNEAVRLARDNAHLGVPGAAEAMVLGGKVSHYPPPRQHVWVPCPDPGAP